MCQQDNLKQISVFVKKLNSIINIKLQQLNFNSHVKKC